MPPLAHLKARKREDYPFLLDYRTRWADNDMYAHMNNSIYNFLFDSVVNTYLIQHTSGIFSPARRTPQYGMVVHSHTDYFASMAFPEVADLGLRVKKMGSSSVHYEIGLFSQGQPNVRAVGVFVQVFVDAATDRPNPQTGMHPLLREGLQKIHVRLPGDDDDVEAGGQEARKSKL